MRIRHAVVLAVLFSCFAGLTGLTEGQDPSNESSRKVVRRVEPPYPQIAKKMNLGGTVKVIAVVAPDGSVKKVEPVGGSPLLVEAAQSAISHWKYAPGAESREVIELHFTP